MRLNSIHDLALFEQSSEFHAPRDTCMDEQHMDLLLPADCPSVFWGRALTD